ncbi:hypothetical protein MKW92_019882, partial [Papaver armeniacum]
MQGMELYPRIGKYFDIKVFTNCRFGMMFWGVLAVTYFLKQEAGYWSKMDIAHDRAGFYIFWGCLVWVPSNYTSPGTYLVNHPVDLGTQVTSTRFIITQLSVICL